MIIQDQMKRWFRYSTKASKVNSFQTEQLQIWMHIKEIAVDTEVP